MFERCRNSPQRDASGVNESYSVASSAFSKDDAECTEELQKRFIT